MELVHGVPITTYCDENKLTPRQRLELFVPICQAIQHAHQKGIIHRDLKPSNILVTMYDDKPVPKVIDFGVAKAIEQRLTEKTLFTQFGTLVGTFEYMSPEQAEMNAFGVDTRSDVYALGVLLYELMTGTTPLERRRLSEAAFDEIRRIIKEEEPPRPSVRLSTSDTLAKVAAARKTEPAKLSRLMRGELDWVVMRCLEKDRSRRYDTASGLARDVERFLKDEPVEARPPSFWYRFRKAARRNRTALSVAGVVAATVLLGATVAVWQAKRASDEEARRIQAGIDHDAEVADLRRKQGRRAAAGKVGPGHRGGVQRRPGEGPQDHRRGRGGRDRSGSGSLAARPDSLPAGQDRRCHPGIRKIHRVEAERRRLRHERPSAIRCVSTEPHAGTLRSLGPRSHLDDSRDGGGLSVPGLHDAAFHRDEALQGGAFQEQAGVGRHRQGHRHSRHADGPRHPGRHGIQNRGRGRGPSVARTRAR
jgi:hypothetical protein